VCPDKDLLSVILVARRSGLVDGDSSSSNRGGILFGAQAITVSALTITRADRHPLHSRESQTERSLSEAVRRNLSARVER
jgi:hypothetical protein